MGNIDRYEPSRDVTPAFLERVAGWIEATGEVLLVLRYLRAAGAKDFALCHTRREFESLVNYVPLGTDIEVLRDRQLPIRGMVDDTFVNLAIHSTVEGAEYLLLTTETRPQSTISRIGRMGDSHAELRDSLAELMGEVVALGPCPDFCREDDGSLVSASKGGIDGPR